jgi:hypothetical protein
MEQQQQEQQRLQDLVTAMHQQQEQCLSLVKQSAQQPSQLPQLLEQQALLQDLVMEVLNSLQPDPRVEISRRAALSPPSSSLSSVT